MKLLEYSEKIRATLPWLPNYVWQRCTRQPPSAPAHLMIAIADHFEPAHVLNRLGRSASLAEQRKHLQTWCRNYPGVVSQCGDSDGIPFRHTYFYPAEQYDKCLVDILVEHCRAGWGEVEIHLHHGVEAPATQQETIATLTRFRDTLAERGCLSQEFGVGPARYAFVHGNWALANSAQGRFCGVDSEMQILADTGCYADFTLPAPSSAQISKINSIYECGLPLNQRAPHRRGRGLEQGRAPEIFPLIVQGPLAINFWRRKNGRLVPGIENSEISGSNPATLSRLNLWRKAGISVQGRPDWIFIKLHCHGMERSDEAAVAGELLRRFLSEAAAESAKHGEYLLHFVTAREMVNIILAACDKKEGDPGQYRDYRFQLAGHAIESVHDGGERVGNPL